MAAEVYHGGTSWATYLRGMNLIRREIGGGQAWYHYNAHGDVAELTDGRGLSIRKYDYDAFGVEQNADPNDRNPFRYCGEYWEGRTETYYLRARSYAPATGRFLQRDPHWNTANMIYGDNPQAIHQRQDVLGLTHYTYTPQITAIMQSGNLYVYCLNSPVCFYDETGEDAVAVLQWGWSAAGVVSQLDSPLPGPADIVALIIGGGATLIAGGIAVYDYIVYASKKPPSPSSKLREGDKVKTPDSHPNEWRKNKDGSYTHDKTGWNAKRDKSGHGGSHWDMKPPRGSGHVNVGPEGNVFGGSHE